MKRKTLMDNTVWIIMIVVAWFVLQRWVLPLFGAQT
jgi:hypothetical protein